jgi:peptidoglycan/LPS O-acetylase OafA/YrhL
LKYRPEIDGLRALAVVPVILFHAGFELFGGGFVGVDVFFVISGYLITTILIEDIENNRFSLANFYERRARRILPALFFVMIVCISFAWIWMLPSQMIDFSQSLVAVSLFASNILFWQESGYFDAAAEEKPLLHTWSLAVEEQYYVMFPIFLFLAWRLGKNRVFWVIVVIAAISLLLSEWGWRNKTTANFYLAPTRSWEIFAGSIAAFCVQKRGVQKSEILSLLGLAAIIFSVFFYDEATPSPSVYILVPVLGAVLLVLFAAKETLAARLLSTRAFVGVGLISYSAYLWHQPLFAFARIRLSQDTSLYLMSALSVVSFLLAICSWKYIEKPFRDGSKLNRNSILAASLSGICALILFGQLGQHSNGFINRFDSNQQEFMRLIDDRQSLTNYVNQSYRKLIKNKKGWTNDGEIKVLIVGDSFSQDLFNALREVELIEQLDVMLISVPVKCGTLFIDKSYIVDLADHEDRDLCKERLSLVEDKNTLSLLQSADYVFLASAWRERHVDWLKQSLDNLKHLTNAEIIIFGTKTLMPISMAHAFMTAKQRAEFTIDLGDKLHIQKRMLSTISDVNFIDIQPILCDSISTNYDVCKPFDSEGMPKAYDGSHLSKFGAIHYGQGLRSKLLCILFNKCSKLVVLSDE